MAFTDDLYTLKYKAQNLITGLGPTDLEYLAKAFDLWAQAARGTARRGRGQSDCFAATVVLGRIVENLTLKD